MRARSLLVALLVGCTFVAGSATAREYVVQIGAFRDLSPAYADAARALGPVTTTPSPAGLTRVQVGPYDSFSAARRARAELRAAGYQDAFVLRAGGAEAPALPAVSAAGFEPTAEHVALGRLPSDVRKRVVVLDGAYHVKEGERFIPVAEYGR